MGNLISCWQGVLCHTMLLSIQPLYFTRRIVLTPKYFTQASTITLTVNLIIWLYILTRLTIPFLTSPLRHLPSPPHGYFPLGHFKPVPPIQIILDMAKSTPNDGLIALWMPFYLGCELVPTTPAAVSDILNTHSYDWEKPAATNKFLSRTLGKGLINVEGSHHKAMRRVVAPAFSGRHIRDLAPLFYRKGLAFADALARQVKESSDNVIEVCEQMSRVTLDIIGAAGVGQDFDTINNNEDILANLYAAITSTDRGNIFIFFMVLTTMPAWILRRMQGTRYARVTNAQDQLRHEARRLMQEKRQVLQDEPEQQKDIISIILRSGELSDDYLISQLLTFLAAGHETTSNTLTWTLMFLSKNPDMQDRLRLELRTHIPQPSHTSTSTEDISADLFDATTTPYLTAVCTETLRFYPSVPNTARHAIRQTKITHYTIPAGSTIAMSMWALNRNPAFWGPDAETYNPDRWLKSATGGATSTYAFLSFLHGPRSCIGQSFAMLEMKVLLAILIMRFEFEMADPDDEPELSGFLTIKPLHGMRLRMVDLMKNAAQG